MVRSILKILNWEIGGLHEAAFLLAISSFSSQILALFRDRMLAGNFGAGRELDIYYASFRIPDFIFISIGSFLAITVLIPNIIEKFESGNGNNTESVNKFMSSLFTVFLICMLFVSVIVFFMMPYLARLIAPGFDQLSMESMITLSRIILLSPFFLGLSNLFGSITQSFKRFFIYALSPVFYNLGIIFGILFFYPIFGLKGLAFGVSLGAFLHLLIQIPVVYKMGMLPKITSEINFNEIKKVSLISLPRTLAMGANQLSIMMLVALGSLMREGSISVFNFSYNLQSVPLAIIGVSYSVAALPEMSRIFARKNLKDFVGYIEKAFKHIVFWSIPVTVLFIVLRAQIVRVVLGTGLFTWDNTRLTVASLGVFAFSVIAQNLIQLLDRAYYAAGNTIKPVFTKIVSAVLIVVLANVLLKIYYTSNLFQVTLEYILRIEGVPGSEIVLLPMAFSLGALFNLTTLFFVFVKDFKLNIKELKKIFIDVFISSFFTGLTSYYLLNFFVDFFLIDTLLIILLQGIFAGMGGIIVGILSLHLLGSNELKEIVGSFKKKFWKAEVVIPGTGEFQS